MEAQIAALQRQAAEPAAAAARAPAGAAAALVGAGAPAGAAPGFDAEDPATWGNPGRNEPCPCGSGEKFKHCHGRLA